MPLIGINLKELSGAWKEAREKTMSSDANYKETIETCISDAITAEFIELCNDATKRGKHSRDKTAENDWLVNSSDLLVRFYNASSDSTPAVYFQIIATDSNGMEVSIYTSSITLPDGFSLDYVYSEDFYITHNESERKFLYKYAEMSFTIPLNENSEATE